LGPQKKNLIKLAVRAVVTVALLIWVFAKIDVRQLLDITKQVNWLLLVVIWIVTLAGFWIQSYKMKLILKKQGCHVDVATIFGVSAVTALYGMVLPGLLDVSVKWYALKRHTGKPSNVLSSMIYNQFTATLVMVILGLAALIMINPRSNWKLSAICAVLLAVIIIASWVLLSSRTGPRLTERLSRILNPFPPKLRKAGVKILQQLSGFQNSGWRFHLNILFLTLAGAIVGGIIVFILSAKAAQIDLPILVLIGQCSLICLLSRLPISVANLGVREATLIESSALYGVNAPSALLMSLIILSNRVLMVVIGAICLLIWTLRTDRKSVSAQHPDVGKNHGAAHSERPSD